MPAGVAVSQSCAPAARLQNGTRRCKMGSIAAATSSSRAPARPRQRRLAVTACHRCLQRQLVAARPQLLHSTRRAGSAAALKSGSEAQQQAGASAKQGLEAAEDAEQRQAGAGGQPPAGQQEEASAGVKAALGALRFYKGFISPLLPNACRFLPTCSAYSMDAFQGHGVGKGFVLTAWRLLRCNPWGNSGYDPVRWPPPGLEAIFGGADGSGGGNGGSSDSGGGGS